FRRVLFRSTWGSGTTGITGSITSSNSLVGGTNNDLIGYEIADSVPNFGVSAFPNGNYLVRSPRWDNPVGPVVDAGAVTIGKGTGGTVGLITFSNSLVGTTPHGLPSVS